MRDLLPAALICAVLSGLLGLFHLFYPWDPPLQKWKSCAGAARRTLLLLAFYFTAYLVAIFIIFFEVTSQLVPRLLFELCWLNGLCVEAAFLQKHFSIPSEIHASSILHILALIITVGAGLLQCAGFAISISNASIGRHLTFAGACLFHMPATAVFIFLLKYRVARHRKPVFFALTYACAAVGGLCFLPISDGDIFLLANCILECFVDSILLASTQIKSHKKERENINVSFGDESSLGLRNESLDTKEDNKGSAGRRSLQIEVEQTAAIHIEQYSLPTPPPSPASHSDPTTPRLNHNICNTWQCSILDIAVSEMGVVQARVLAISETQNGRMLRLITIDWENISHNWPSQLKEYVGESIYDIAERLSSKKCGAGMVLLAERDLCDVGLSLKDCQSLLDGSDIDISRQPVLENIQWMYNCKGCY